MSYKVNVPPGEKGNIKIDRFTIDEDGMPGEALSTVEFIEAASCLIDHTRAGRRVPPGQYTRLLVDGKVMMSDTPAEIQDHLEFIEKAEGDVLITGLGLGMVVKALLTKRSVRSIDIIERNQNVIDLVWPTYKGGKAKVWFGDAFSLRLGKRYDWAWHDIWPTISDENWPQMKRLEELHPSRNTLHWKGDDCEIMWIATEALEGRITKQEMFARLGLDRTERLMQMVMR